MFNKKLCSLFIGVALLFSASSGTIYSMEEVNKCKNSSDDCKISLTKPVESGGITTVEVYCRDNSCFTVDGYGSTAEIPDATTNSNKTLIVDICNYERVANNRTSDSAYFSHCSPECHADSDCFTNKCLNNKCVENNAISLEKCQEAYHYHILTISHSYDFTCGKPHGYTCKSHSECASGKCTGGECERFNGDYHNMDEFASYFFYGIVIIIALITCCCICCCCCGKDKKNNNVV